MKMQDFSKFLQNNKTKKTMPFKIFVRHPILQQNKKRKFPAAEIYIYDGGTTEQQNFAAFWHRGLSQPSLTAPLFSPNQCEARRYCKVKQRKAAGKEQPGMNIHAVAIWLRTRICTDHIPTHPFV